MGIALTSAIFVDDAGFQPIHSQLVEVASVLHHVGVIEECEKTRLIKSISSEEYDSNERIVFGMRNGVIFRYRVIRLPWIYGISEEAAEPSVFHEMTIRAKDEPLSDGEYSTLFTIASQLSLPPVDLEKALIRLERIQKEPMMVELLAELSKALKRNVQIGLFIHT